MRKELPEKAEARLRQIERMRDALDGQRSQYHEIATTLRLRRERLQDELSKQHPDDAGPVEWELGAVRKQMADNSAWYEDIGRKGMRLNALRENLQKYLNTAGYLQLDELNPRPSTTPIIHNAQMFPSQKSVEASRAERLVAKGWKE